MGMGILITSCSCGRHLSFSSSMGAGNVWRKCSCRVAQSGQRSCTSRVAQSWKLRKRSRAILEVAQAKFRNPSCAIRPKSCAILVAQSGEVVESDLILPFICMHIPFMLHSFPVIFRSLSFHLYSFPFIFLSYSFHFHSNVHACPFFFLSFACIFLSFCIHVLNLWKWLYGLARGSSATNGYR